MDMMKTLTSSAAALALSVGLASASTVTFEVLNASPDDGAANQAHIFGAGYGAFTPAGWSWYPASGPSVQTGSTNLYKSPWAGDATAVANNSYFAVGPQTGPNPVTLNFGPNVTSFTMLLGSVDLYNEFAFGGLGPAVTGLNIAAAANLAGFGTPCVDSTEPQWGNFNCTVLLRFSVDPSQGGPSFFTTMEVSSDSQAAEFALIPLPASALLLLGGMGVFGGMAAMRRRKEKPSA